MPPSWNMEIERGLSEKTKKELEEVREQIMAGKFYTHDQVKKNLIYKH
jgi:hypothetical protein